MIARLWRGWTTRENAGTYEGLLRTEILPGIAAREIPGYHGAHLLRTDRESEVEFLTILWFDSLDAVRAFQGEDYSRAYVPDRARAVLERFDRRSAHYHVVEQPGALRP